VRFKTRDPPKNNSDPPLRNISFVDTYYQVCSAQHTWYLEAVPELMRDIADRAEQFAMGKRV
jgi:hypothetical protein